MTTDLPSIETFCGSPCFLFSSSCPRELSPRERVELVLDFFVEPFGRPRFRFAGPSVDQRDNRTEGFAMYETKNQQGDYDTSNFFLSS